MRKSTCPPHRERAKEEHGSSFDPFHFAAHFFLGRARNKSFRTGPYQHDSAMISGGVACLRARIQLHRGWGNTTTVPEPTMVCSVGCSDSFVVHNCKQLQLKLKLKPSPAAVAYPNSVVQVSESRDRANLLSSRHQMSLFRGLRFIQVGSGRTTAEIISLAPCSD